MAAQKAPARLVRRKDRAVPADEELEGFEILPDLVGKGSYSNIYKAKSNDYPGKIFVAKVSSKHAKRAVTNYNGAVDTLSNISHPHIIKLLAYQETSTFYYEFLEYLDKPVMTLTELLKLSGSTLAPSIVTTIFAQLVGATAFLHMNGFGHRDLKPDNIMVHPQTLHVTLIDFGFAMRTNSLCEDFSGSPIYAAPEILNFEAYSVDQADLWSLGVVLYQMCFGAYPYPAKDLQELTNKVNRLPLSFPSNLSGPLADLVVIIQGLMQKDASKRVSAQALSSRLCKQEEIYGTVSAPLEDVDDPMDVEFGEQVAASSLS